MNFEKLYNNMLSETNVAGGAASAFGPNGGGKVDGGAHVGPAQDTYATGDDRKPEILGAKRKKKKKIKKLPKMKETGNPSFGPVQTRNFPTDLMMPGRGKHIKEDGEIQQEFIQAALPILAKGGALAGKAALGGAKLAGKALQSYGRGALALGGKALQGAGTLATKAGNAVAATGAQTAAAALGTDAEMQTVDPNIQAPQMDVKQVDTLAGAAIAPLASLDKANFDKVYQKIMQGLNQLKTQIK